MSPTPAACEVLLIDDDPVTTTILDVQARAAGLSSLSAGNGREAIAMLRSGVRPRLIVTDIEMPHADGFEVLSFVRSSPSLAGVILVVYSSAERPRGNGGADIWLTKGAPELMQVTLREFGTSLGPERTRLL